MDLHPECIRGAEDRMLPAVEMPPKRVERVAVGSGLHLGDRAAQGLQGGTVSSQ
jgi:hypothetical protein